MDVSLRSSLLRPYGKWMILQSNLVLFHKKGFPILFFVVSISSVPRTAGTSHAQDVFEIICNSIFDGKLFPSQVSYVQLYYVTASNIVFIKCRKICKSISSAAMFCSSFSWLQFLLQRNVPCKNAECNVYVHCYVLQVTFTTQTDNIQVPLQVPLADSCDFCLTFSLHGDGLRIQDYPLYLSGPLLSNGKEWFLYGIESSQIRYHSRNFHRNLLLSTTEELLFSVHKFISRGISDKPSNICKALSSWQF